MVYVCRGKSKSENNLYGHFGVCLNMYVCLVYVLDKRKCEEGRRKERKGCVCRNGKGGDFRCEDREGGRARGKPSVSATSEGLGKAEVRRSHHGSLGDEGPFRTGGGPARGIVLG